LLFLEQGLGRDLPSDFFPILCFFLLVWGALILERREIPPIQPPHSKDFLGPTLNVYHPPFRVGRFHSRYFFRVLPHPPTDTPRRVPLHWSYYVVLKARPTRPFSSYTEVRVSQKMEVGYFLFIGAIPWRASVRPSVLCILYFRSFFFLDTNGANSRTYFFLSLTNGPLSPQMVSLSNLSPLPEKSFLDLLLHLFIDLCPQFQDCCREFFIRDRP